MPFDTQQFLKEATELLDRNHREVMADLREARIALDTEMRLCGEVQGRLDATEAGLYPVTYERVAFEAQRLALREAREMVATLESQKKELQQQLGTEVAMVTKLEATAAELRTILDDTRDALKTVAIREHPGYGDCWCGTVPSTRLGTHAHYCTTAKQVLGLDVP